ncbi:MAG: SLBB domain-containing protein [Bacteroidota bacterium]
MFLLLGVGNFAKAQPVTTQGQTPPPNIQGQLPNLQNRIDQLRNANVPLNQLPTIPGTTTIPGQIGTQPGTLNPSSSSGFPAAGPPIEDVILEGDDAVLEEEDAEFEDKPIQVNEVNLTPAIVSNIFGLHLFRDSSIKFNQSGTRIPPDDYIVGPGDMFGITVYGSDEFSESLSVADDGSIQRQYIGKIYVLGLTYARARKLLEERYRGFVGRKATIEILLVTNRRSINVNIVGEVRKPGSYRISASTTAFNSLYAAAGINNIGSVRNIQIKRLGKTIQTLDLYDFLVYGRDDPIYLKDNDFIYVPVQGKVVEIEGAVKRPMEYELKETENLNSLLEFAGGLNYDALRKEAQIARLDRFSEREVLRDIDLRSYLEDEAKDYKMFSGDRLIVKSVNKGAFNIVQVFGNVEYPDTYQLFPGERVSDLVTRAGGLGIDAYLDRAYIVRIVPNSSEVVYIPINLNQLFKTDSTEFNESNNLILQFFDALVIFSKNDFLDKRDIIVEGEVRKPGIYETSPTMTLKDLLFYVGGIKRDADFNNVELSIITRAEDLNIERLRQQQEEETQGESSDSDVNAVPGKVGDVDNIGSMDGMDELGTEEQLVQRISIDENWQEDPLIDTLLIHNYDRVRVFSKYEFFFFKYIDVEGSVVNPGRYQLKRGMTLKDLLYQTGGLAEDADVNEVELYVDIDLEERGNFNNGTDRQEIVRIKIEEDWQNSIAADSIEMADFHKVVVRSEKDFFSPGYVEVVGLVNNPDTFQVHPNMSLRDLLYMAEGLKMEADFENIELSRVIETEDATGEIIPIPVVLHTVSTDQNWQDDLSLDELKVNSFDKVFVRKNPAFELQESVFIQGEVYLEGEYVKATKAERISSLIARAGGVTELADLAGAYLRRENIGSIAIKLDRALKRQGSKFDIPMLEGDTLVVPPRVDVVTITGNVLKPETTVLFEPSHQAFKYYVNLAGGFDRRTKRKLNTVTYVDGRVKSTRNFLFFRKNPRIEQGSIIYVERKPDRENDGKPRLRINAQEIMASISSMLTFYLLIDRTFTP